MSYEVLITDGQVCVERDVMPEDWTVYVCVGQVRLQLTPDEAAELAADLEAAATEPQRCHQVTFAQTRDEPAEYCENYAIDGSDHCGFHGGGDPT